MSFLLLLCAAGSLSLAVFGFMVVYRGTKKVLSDLRARIGSSDEEVDGVAESYLLRILCQNMWCTNSLFAEAKGSRGPRPRDRFDSLVAESHQYDILILQELFVMRVGFHLIIDDVDHLRRKLVEKGFVYHTDLAYNLPLCFGQSAGVAIFSRWPIVSCEHATFAKRSFKDYLNEKGYVQATIKLPSGKTTHVFSTHLDSTRKETVRFSQIEQLGVAVQRVKASGRVVLAGDFNIHRKTVQGANEYKFLQEKLSPLVDIFPDVECDHLFITSSASSNGKIKLVSDEILNLNTPDGIPLSDHFGLKVTLSVK